MEKNIDLVVQYFHGCPNGPKMIANVKSAIKEFGDDVVYSEKIIDTPELAVIHKFRGSPTLLINGEDFEGMEVPKEISLSCRFYLDGIPSTEKIVERIKDLMKDL